MSNTREFELANNDELADIEVINTEDACPSPIHDRGM